jgi:tetratricopeptide (TPR) repeat protein
MLIRLIWVLLLLFFSVLPAAAQPLSVEIEKLNSLFQEFRYQEVIRQGVEILDQNPNLPVIEKSEILRLLALSYYARQDMQGTLRNFSEILKLDDNYRLDPRENSPKILAFFEEIRHQFKESGQAYTQQKDDSLMVASQVMLTDSLEKAAYRRMALSFVLPGSGQIWRGEKIKGWFQLGGSFALLGATIYFAAETSRLNDEYLRVTDRGEISTAYDKYNQAYQKRNLAFAGFVILWLYTQIDFLFLSSSSSHVAKISWYPTVNRSGRATFTIALTL